MSSTWTAAASQGRRSGWGVYVGLSSGFRVDWDSRRAADRAQQTGYIVTSQETPYVASPSPSLLSEIDIFNPIQLSILVSLLHLLASRAVTSSTASNQIARWSERANQRAALASRGRQGEWSRYRLQRGSEVWEQGLLPSPTTNSEQVLADLTGLDRSYTRLEEVISRLSTFSLQSILPCDTPL